MLKENYRELLENKLEKMKTQQNLYSLSAVQGQFKNHFFTEDIYCQ